jgi:hypothetical protein
MIMTLKEFAQMLDGREYLNEITKEEEALAKELGFVVVFGYSDDNAELRGAIDDEIGCFDGGKLEHKDLPDVIYAKWCDAEIKYPWSYKTTIPHETFRIYEDGDYWCVGIVCDINKPKQTNADRIRAMSDEELAKFIPDWSYTDACKCDELPYVDCNNECSKCVLEWLKQPARED